MMITEALTPLPLFVAQTVSDDEDDTAEFVLDADEAEISEDEDESLEDLEEEEEDEDDEVEEEQ